MRKAQHTSFFRLLQYHVTLYYNHRDRNPGLTLDADKHIAAIEKIERLYLRCLRNDYPDWDTEENKEQFRSHIDYLTKVFTKKKEAAEKANKYKSLTNNIKVKMRTPQAQ